MSARGRDRRLQRIVTRVDNGVPRPESFASRLRTTAVTARVGVWLGVCFTIAFVTGLWSHYQQTPPGWFTLPTRPVQLYRYTQGLHVIAGTAAVPLLLVKLWTVYPKLFERLDRRRVRRLAVQGAERLSIALLVSAAIFQLATGLANVSHWYPWSFSFRSTHYAVGWIAFGALVLHVAVKLPLIRDAFKAGVDPGAVSDDGAAVEPPAETPGTAAARPPDAVSSGLSRRGLLRATWLATGVVVLSTAGATVPFLRRVSVLGVRDGDGPQGVPVNKSAVAAGVTDLATDPAYRLLVTYAGRSLRMSRSDLGALPQTPVELPIACVEGWSAMAQWRGVRLRDLLALLDAPTGLAVAVESLQPEGPFRTSVIPPQFVDDPLTVLALEVNGADLDLDHGYPCRIIAPNRPGVRQTKWVGTIEVLA
jgi:hypothetical protein